MISLISKYKLFGIYVSPVLLKRTKKFLVFSVQIPKYNKKKISYFIINNYRDPWCYTCDVVNRCSATNSFNVIVFQCYCNDNDFILWVHSVQLSQYSYLLNKNIFVFYLQKSSFMVLKLCVVCTAMIMCKFVR